MKDNIELLFFFTISVIFIKIGKQSDFHLSFYQTVETWQDFPVVPNLIEFF